MDSRSKNNKIIRSNSDSTVNSGSKNIKTNNRSRSRNSSSSGKSSGSNNNNSN